MEVSGKRTARSIEAGRLGSSFSHFHYAPQLVAMGTIARKGIHGLITGNTAERLLPLIRCSILAAEPESNESPSAFHCAEESESSTVCQLRENLRMIRELSGNNAMSPVGGSFAPDAVARADEAAFQRDCPVIWWLTSGHHSRIVPPSAMSGNPYATRRVTQDVLRRTS